MDKTINKNENDDCSSDSSIDNYFESPDKINLDNSFFSKSIDNEFNTKRNKNIQLKQKNNIVESSSDESDDEFISEESDYKSSTVLLAEVMKNLERINSNNGTTINKSNELPITPSTSKQLSLIEEKNTSAKSDLLSNEINDLLLKGESGLGSSNFQLYDDNNQISDDKYAENSIYNYSIPNEGIDITLPNTGLIFNHRKKRSGIDFIDELRKKLNRRLKSNQIYIHKVGLLCWLAHGFHLNKQINDPELMSIVLSLVPQKSYPKNRVDLKYLEQFTRWFKGLIKIELNNRNTNDKKNCKNDFTIAVTKNTLIKGLTDKKVDNYRELVLLYICALRSIGINCRLIVSLYPPDLKPRNHDLFHTQSSTTKQDKNDKDDGGGGVNDKNDDDRKKKKNSKIINKNEDKKKVESIYDDDDDDDDDDDELKPMKIISKNSKQLANITAEETKKRAAEIIRSKYMKKSDEKKKFNHDAKEKNLFHDKEKIISPVQVRQLRSRAIIDKNSVAKVSNTQKKNTKNDNYNNKDDRDNRDDSEKKGGKKKQQKKSAQKNKNESKNDDIIDRRVLSPVKEIENEDKIDIKNNGYYNYLWVEVYVESEENWICVNIPDNKIHCISEIYKKLPSPVLYIIAFNSLGKIKDVTRRYCSNWLTVTRKHRVDEKWWNETLSSWKEAQTTISKAEDESLIQTEYEQPLPKLISGCKGHPLYVLVRHLLKFEALYPPDCVPLGHLKNGEAIYSRHCVHTLRSRETWLRQARVVKPAQEPYKIVKSMPKYDKLTGQMVKNQPLELFGYWQTMAYVSPEAKNGKVPRNEYGNVDLFQKCMLPKGTVHIDLPGLFRIAKKKNIDCVPAVVGFNFGGRGAMPMTQGYIVCEEFEDELREAWEEEQVKAVARTKEKRDKRIWGNWRKLIRGLLIREKIIAKYELTNDRSDDDDDDDDDKDDASKKLKRKKKSDKTIVKKKKHA